mmetsp:Transcript_18430/g.31522  ORF Transcript_18430/g.31522 Transcript_18430/m.31522 type:complete len:87 (+) Transcript_18430:628-888(+)
MAAISESAEHVHEVLDQIFVTKEVNSAGIYVLKLFIRGRQQIVVVDDEFLFITSEDNLRFAKFLPESNSLWVPILEKAMAKVKGTY